MMEPLLQATNLEKHYKTRASTVRALDGVNLEIFEGETLASNHQRWAKWSFGARR
jgi:ABC-type oligopeptide transport system ATPase subunit